MSMTLGILASSLRTGAGPEPPSGLYFEDDFNRADGPLGSNWDYINPSVWPSCAIVSNKLDFNNGNMAAVWATPCATQDQFIEADITVGTSEAGSLMVCGLLGDDTPHSGYTLNIYQWDSRPQIDKDGSFVYAFDSVLSGEGTYRVTFRKVGNTFSCTVNGASAGAPWVDTGALLTSDRVGLRSENVSFDNVVGGDYPPPSSAELTLLQFFGTGNWSDDANFVPAYPSNLTAGSLLVVSCECRATAVPTISDSGGHTWTLQESSGPYPSGAFMSARHMIWTAPNTGTAACTVTIDWTGTEGMFGCVMITEVSNAVLADAVLTFGNTAAVSVGPTVAASAAGMGLLFVHACEELAFTVGSPAPADIDQDWGYPMNGYLLAHAPVAASATFTGTCTTDPTPRVWAAAAVLLQASS